MTGTVDLAVLEQREGGQEQKRSASTNAFTASASTWGFPRLISLDELASPDRAFLKDDRLMLRADLCVTSVSRGGGA